MTSTRITELPLYQQPASREQVTVYGPGNAWAATTARFRPMIERHARAIAGKDPGLYDDLVQAGEIAIWELDPSRYLPQDEGYFRNSVVTQILMAVRREADEAGWGIVEQFPEEKDDEDESYD